jgi:hypothetical protein
MLPLAGTPERAELEAEAQAIALRILDQEFLEIGGALHKLFLLFRMRFLTERDLLEAENQGQAWHDCVTDARQLVAFVHDLWALQIRSGHASAGAAQ